MGRPLRWSALLLPLTPLYAGAVAVRREAYRRGWRRTVRPRAAVVSVGNLTFGGTGKTPTVIALVRDLVRRGRRPAVLTRGYGRSDPSPRVLFGPDPQLEPWQAGDEPLEMAAVLPGVPIVVDADRARGAVEAERRGADVLVLDDGFQHLRLERDLDLVLLDAGDPFGGGRLPPAGRLREPVTAVARADAVLVTKLPHGADATFDTIRGRVQQIAPGLPVMAAAMRPLRVRTAAGVRPPGALAGRRVVAFAGIGRPSGFERLLTDAGAEVAARQWFDDHHAYTERELAELEQRAAACDAVLVTTAKDAVRLPREGAWVVEAEMVPRDGSWDGLWGLMPGIGS
jgi:tetraacyldisaccharide 4'-kinase